MSTSETKPCTSCGGPKPVGRGRRLCDKCLESRKPLIDRRSYQARLQRTRDLRAHQGKNRKFAELAPEGMKWCPRCQQYLAIEEFGAAKRRKDGRAAHCGPCSSAYLHEYRLRTVFKIDPEEYYRLSELQDGRCAICFCKPRTRRLAVDHDHGTGEVRGLLCTRCNHKILGSAREDPVILRRAARYLDQPPALTGQPMSADESGDLMLRAEQELADLAKDDKGLPIVVTRPDGAGPATVDDWPVILRHADLRQLLRQAGYGDPIDEAVSK